MKCYNHSEVVAIGVCTSCGKAVCQTCAVQVQDNIMCRNCLAVGKVTSNSPDPNTALLVEMVGGFFGLMGLGHIYAGRTTDGLIFLIGWLTYLALSWTVIGLLSLVAVGFCLIPAQLLIHIGVPIWLAVKLRNELETQTYQIST